MAFEFTYGTENDDVVTFDTTIPQRVFFAGNGDDIITGANFSNYGGNHLGSTWEIIYGEDGNDIISTGGSVKNSILDGGNGNDKITSYSITSDIYGGDGNDIIKAHSYVSYIYGGAGNDIINSSSRTSFVYGGDGNDIITVQADSSYIYGGAGNDTIYSNGSYGQSLVSGGLGSDKMYGQDFYMYHGSVSILSSDIIDYSDSQSAIHINLNYQGKDAILFGTATDSTAYGDEIYNFSNLIAGEGNDKIIGNNFSNIISLDAGDDEAYGQNGDDILLGGNGNNTLYGGAGNDTLVSGADNDRLLGGDGDDRIFLGFGKDNAWGGNGADTFTVQKSGHLYSFGDIIPISPAPADTLHINNSTIANTDIIRDFNSTEDIIDLSRLGISLASVQIGASKTVGITGFNISANGVFSIDVLTGNTGDLTLANVIL